VITARLGSGDSTCVELAAALVAALQISFRIEDVSLTMEASVGIAVAGQHIRGADDLLRAADLALHEAKTTNVDVVVHDPIRHVNDPQRLVLLADLRESMNAEHDLTLHYQPKIDLAHGRVTGVEALVRWQHPSRGTVPPGAFISAAEGTGLITRLTDHVLDLALSQARDWLVAGQPLQVAVNLSARCLTDQALPIRIHEALQRHEVGPELLRLEVTESAVMADPRRAFDILNQLRGLGLALSVDDFGTGYTSMAHLKELTFEELKIDRSFITGITRNPADQALTQATIELGHAFGLTVVAEGVEHHDQETALRAAGCDAVQGYLYAKPMPAETISRWLANRPDHTDLSNRNDQHQPRRPNAHSAGSIEGQLKADLPLPP
jgi:predicted signal transduction protein with EAL and GGDEF domain